MANRPDSLAKRTVQKSGATGGDKPDTRAPDTMNYESEANLYTPVTRDIADNKKPGTRGLILGDRDNITRVNKIENQVLGERNTNVEQRSGLGIKNLSIEAPIVGTDNNGNREWQVKKTKPRAFLVNDQGDITNAVKATEVGPDGRPTSLAGERYWGNHYDPKALNPSFVSREAAEDAWATNLAEYGNENIGDDKAVAAAKKRQGRTLSMVADLKRRLRNGEAPSQAMIEARQRWAAQPGSRPTQSGRALAQAQQVQSYLSSTDAAADRYREMQKNNRLYSTQVRPTYLSGEDNYETAMQNARKEAEERLKFEEEAYKAELKRRNAQVEAIRAGATALTNLGTNPSPSTIAAAAQAAGGTGETPPEPPKKTK